MTVTFYGYGVSSIGRVAVSKTVGCRFESCPPCQTHAVQGSMKSTPSRPGAPARAGGNRPPSSTPQKRPAPAAQRAANAQRTQDFVRGVIAEMRRVTWPSREEWIAATLLTIALVVGVGVFTYVCDLLFGLLFGWLTGGTR